MCLLLNLKCVCMGLSCCHCSAAAAAAAACSPKKRARVAAAPERYADLVSNMTSQGGGDDTDSDADDQAGANAREVRDWLDSTRVFSRLLLALLTVTSAVPQFAFFAPFVCRSHLRRTWRALRALCVCWPRSAQAARTRPAFTAAAGGSRPGHKSNTNTSHRAASKATAGAATAAAPAGRDRNRQQQQQAGAGNAERVGSKRAAPGPSSHAVAAAAAAGETRPAASKGGRLAAMATSSRLTQGGSR
jgi:hypothetical protein